MVLKNAEEYQKSRIAGRLAAPKATVLVWETVLAENDAPVLAPR